MADVLDEARCEAEVGHGGLEIVAGEERLAEGAESQQRGEADRERASRHRKRGPLLLAVRMAALDEGDAPREDEGEQEQDEADDAGGREDDGERVAHEPVHHAARTADVDNEIYKTIVAAYQTQYVAEFLLENYKEAFFPAFAYDSNLTMTKEDADALVQYVSDPADKILVKVGVCGANNDQWTAVQKVLDDENAGIYIELVEFDAYNLPNEALNSGDIDLNAFQHKAYMNNDAEKNGYELVSIGDTLIAPLTLYSQQFDSLDALKEAAGAAE